MIWGLTLEPGRLYPINLQHDEIQLSMAALDSRAEFADSDSSVRQKAKIMLHTHSNEFLLCTLVHGAVYQQSLDMKLRPKDKLSLSILGYGTVHITGYTNEYYETSLPAITTNRSKEVYDEVEKEPSPKVHDEIVWSVGKSLSRRKKPNPQKSHQHQNESPQRRSPFTERQQVVLLKQMTSSEMRKQVSGSPRSQGVTVKAEPRDEDSDDDDGGTQHEDDILEETFAVQNTDVGGWIEEMAERNRIQSHASVTSGPTQSSNIPDDDEVDDMILNDLFPELAGGSPNTSAAKPSTEIRRKSDSDPVVIEVPGLEERNNKIENDVSKLKCRHCNRNFPTEFDLKNHEALHQYKCPRCKKFFTSRKNVRRHSFTCTGEQKQPLLIKIPQPPKARESSSGTPRKTTMATIPRFPMYRCKFCSKKFPTNQSLEDHERLHRHPCKRCHRLFTTLTNLKRHRLLNICKPFSGAMPPKITPSTKTSPKGASSVPKAEVTLTPNKCKFCTRTYPTEKEWREHEALHIHPCKLCKKMFTSRKSLRAHELHKKCPFLNRPPSPSAVNDDPLPNEQFKCQYCRKGFDSEEELKDHESFHVHECKHCNRIYTSAGNLRKHLKIAHRSVTDNEKAFRCRYCPKSYDSYAQQVKHEMLHKGLKLKMANKGSRNEKLSFKTKAKYSEMVRVKCELCSKRITVKNMKCHMLLHKGEKPYKCLKCGRAYFSVSGLRKHQRKCTNPMFKCRVCQKTFANKTTLVRHEIIHTSLQPYKCSFCPKAFNSASSCKRHEYNLHQKLGEVLEKQGNEEVNVEVVAEVGGAVAEEQVSENVDEMVSLDDDVSEGQNGSPEVEEVDEEELLRIEDEDGVRGTEEASTITVQIDPPHGEGSDIDVEELEGDVDLSEPI